MIFVSSSNAGEDASDFGPTWVDHLHHALRDGKGYRAEPQRIDSFAFSGATAEEDLQSQLSRFFNEPELKNTDTSSKLDPSHVLYGEWLVCHGSLSPSNHRGILHLEPTVPLAES